MDIKRIILGLIILVIFAGGLILIKNSRTPKPVPSSTPSIVEKIKNNFKYQIPDDIDKVELKDVSGGMGSGLATRDFSGGKFSHVVLADLPEPASGSFYEGWLVKGKEGESNYSLLPTGKLSLAKGGYLLEFESNKDYSDYNQVLITLEKKDDRNPENRILEGSF